MVASSSSGGGAVIPNLMKRFLEGESEHGGPLLKLSINRWGEAPRSAPPEEKGKEADRSSGEGKRRHRHQEEEGERRSKDREREKRAATSRPEGSTSQASGSHRRDDDIPVVKIKNAIEKGLRSVFVH